MTDVLAQLVDREKQDGQLETTEKFVRNLVNAGFPFDQIVSLTEASDDVVHDIIDRIETGSQPQQS